MGHSLGTLDKQNLPGSHWGRRWDNASALTSDRPRVEYKFMSKIIIATYYLFLQYYNYYTILFYRPNCYCLISVKVKVSFCAVSSIMRIWKCQSVSVTWGHKLMDASQHSIVSSRAADLHTSVNNHSPEAEVQ